MNTYSINKVNTKHNHKRRHSLLVRYTRLVSNVFKSHIAHFFYSLLIFLVKHLRPSCTLYFWFIFHVSKPLPLMLIHDEFYRTSLVSEPNRDKFDKTSLYYGPDIHNYKSVIENRQWSQIMYG
jgi:hypothetical protein